MSARNRLPSGRLGAILSFVGISAIAGVLATVAVTPAIALTGMAANNSIGMFENLPSYLKIGNLPEKTNIYAQREVDGKEKNVRIASFYAENRESVGWDQVSPFAKAAAVAAEDPRYYEHGGIDPVGVVRAAVLNVLGSDVQGASTITQQYVKNVLVAQATGLATEEERDAAYQEATKVSFDRKLREMRLAIGLEKEYSKDDILLGYLNIALFGGRVYGIQAASKYYYGVTAKDLTLSQAASLLAIVNNPQKFRLDQPDDEMNGKANGYAANKVRRDYILGNMLEGGKISKAEHDEAVAAAIEPKITPAPSGCSEAKGNAGFFCDYVVNVIKNDTKFGATAEERYNSFIRGGFKVFTTLDLDMQKVAQDSVNAAVPMTMDGVDIGSAATSVEAGTGAIKVMVQNKKFDDSADPGPEYTAVNYNTDSDYGASGGFQAASTYKTFTLIAWLRAGHTLGEGMDISEQTYDWPSFRTCDGGTVGSGYVENDDNESGWRSVLDSTAHSINGGFMKMGQQLDQCDIRKAATDLMVHPAGGGELADNPSAILGTNLVSPLTMATAYAGIANQGKVCSPVAIMRMIKPDGTDADIPETTCKQGIEKDVAAATAYALRGPIENGSAIASNPYDGIDHLAKTGTNDNNQQTWTTGASTKMGLAVWVGQVSGDANLRQTFIDGVQASTLRHAIWKPIMTALDAKYGGDPFPAVDDKYLRGIYVSVPDVTGQTIDGARNIIEGAGFNFADGGSRPSSAPKGTVVGSDPAGGSSASRGSTITVYTSDGTPQGLVVPNVVGQTAGQATQALNAAGFANVGYVLSGDTSQPACTVTATDPAAGATADPAATVTLAVSPGDGKGDGNGNGQQLDPAACQ
ncbi:MAG: hypothetical protein JWR33_1480 [Naasia sp.]|jgi:membrane peptidoglycan carboxypeptidase|uniref:transglycosylase domain-containing protein n=1 Tax=Naasia sp. TaxID=2546198 RepID=UPI00261DFB67|nr:transglycosylase domain-containing protein [Naasia sp.]MCU1570739.1 hypothetical protein [Naasia sp.]